MGRLVMGPARWRLLGKGRCGGRETYQRSSGEIIYEDETDSVAALGGGVRGVQHGNGVSAGAGCAVALAEERAARSPAPRSADGYLRSRSCYPAGGGAGPPGRGGVGRIAAAPAGGSTWGGE